MTTPAERPDGHDHPVQMTTDPSEDPMTTTETTATTAYISIGNSDDKLSQAEWSQYVVEIIARVVSIGRTHGAWYSLPHTPYQNACWCVEFGSAEDVREAREVATEIREKYRQDSIAWAHAETEFI